MSAFSEETPIDPKTYKFVRTLPHHQKIKKLTQFKQEHYRLIHKVACSEGISYSRALERILDSAEYKGIIQPRPSLREKAQNTIQRYASYNLTQTSGKQVKGFPPKAKGKRSK